MTESSGRDIDGALIVGSSGNSPIFTGNAPLSGDAIQIIVRPTLEDVAAYNFQDLLDHVDGEIKAISQKGMIVPLTPSCN